MARPRADSPGPNARERLENAFWSMLSEKDYSLITVEGLSRRAEVNHNTLYKHFKTLDEYALECAGGEVAENLARYAVPLFCGRMVKQDIRGEAGFRSPLVMVRSIAGNGSSAHVKAMLGGAVSEWARGEGVDPASLCDREFDEVMAVFGGVSAALASMDAIEIRKRAEGFGKSPLGKSFADTLDRVVTAHRSGQDGQKTLK